MGVGAGLRIYAIMLPSSDFVANYHVPYHGSICVVLSDCEMVSLRSCQPVSKRRFLTADPPTRLAVLGICVTSITAVPSENNCRN